MLSGNPERSQSNSTSNQIGKKQFRSPKTQSVQKDQVSFV